MIDFTEIGRWERPIIIAHRGTGHRWIRPRGSRLRDLRNIVHENSIRAFEAAVKAGAGAIEFDLRRTADGIIVIHHNKWLKRSSIPIREMTFSRLQRQAEKYGFEIPTLEEALETCSGRISLDIELKETGYEEAVVKAVRPYYDLRNVVFTSFIDSTVLKLKSLTPDAKTGLLLGLRPPASVMSKGLKRTLTINRIRACRADFVAPHWRLLNMPFFNSTHKPGLPVFAWTVNRLPIAEKLISGKPAAIITDFPEKLLPLVKS
jgi:glycerophosphoryl diester phosphodiesterase